jgi:hypothetical protein
MPLECDDPFLNMAYGHDYADNTMIPMSDSWQQQQRWTDTDDQPCSEIINEYNITLLPTIKHGIPPNGIAYTCHLFRRYNTTITIQSVQWEILLTLENTL